jgi:CheY-like chemotaxis protein
MKHILVVDDDGAVLRVLVKALAGYQLTVARDGHEALAAIGRTAAIDLVITDYLMPGMMGDELIGRLKEIRPDLKALVITAHGDILDHEQQAWWAESRRLTKPFGLETLLAVVSDLIGEPEGIIAPYPGRSEPPSGR